MNVLDLAKSSLIQAAKKFKTEPYLVTPTQFWTVKTVLKEWDIRKNGGLTNIKKQFWPQEKPPKGEKAVKFTQRKLEAFNVKEDNIADVFKLCGVGREGVLRVVVQPDTHCPEIDVAAINAFCEFLGWYKPHGIINLGDFLENESVSHWPSHSAKAKRLVPEMKVARQILDRIDSAAGKQCKYKRFLMGNHEDWIEQYLVQRIPEIIDGAEELGIKIDVDSLLGLSKRGYESVPVNDILSLGQANFIHGYYTGTHHASKHLSVFGCNLYYGHVHDVQSHSSVSVKGLHEAMSLGCLRDLNAPFLKGKPSNWVHAFGVFEYRYDGAYTRYVPIMIDGKFSFYGKIFNGK